MAYDKHEWVTDEIITAALLNNIEDGIEAVDAAVEGITVPTELPPTDGSVTNAKVAASAAIALSKLANVAAGDDGLASGGIQDTFQALATRIQALEDAAGE